MEQYVKDFLFVIRNGDTTNTYKYAWARAIVECCVNDPATKRIEYDQLAERVFGYFWDQTFFFNLEQTPNLNKRAAIHQIVVEAVETYRAKYGNTPKQYMRISDRVDVDVKRIGTIFSQDVSWRFLKVGSGEYNHLYQLNRQKRYIDIPYPELLCEYADVLFETVNYYWVQKLEQCNHSPRIAAKVRGTDKGKLKRSSLNKFRQFLDIENPQKVCFYTGKKIAKGELSIDHVIPWSYLYSDDLWNLVYTTKSFNSSKSNNSVSESVIEQLENRNMKLLELLDSGELRSTHIEGLRLAIDRDFVRAMWVGSRG